MRFRAELYGGSKLRTCACGHTTRTNCRQCGEPVCQDFERCELPHRLAQRQQQPCPSRPRPAVGAVALVIGALLFACAAPRPVPPPPLLSTAVDIEHLVPPRPLPAPADDRLQRYPDIPIDEGDCPGKPAGVLVSDGARADLVELAIDRNRLLVTNRVYRELRLIEWESFRRVEAIHLEHIAQIEHERQRQLRMVPWRFWGGFALGAAVMVAGGLTAAQVGW